MVSACLLGEHCRYDGQTKQLPELLKKLENCEIIPFCPEAPLFGTPRERINVVVEGGKYSIKKESGADVTQMLEDEILSFFHNVGKIDAVVLKSKSPSCGNGTTPLLDSEKKQIALGDGIAVKLIKQEGICSVLYDEVSLFEE